MPPTLLAADRQATYRPVWFMSCAQFPRTYATRDIDIPFVVPGTIFTVGDSVVGGEDLVGGGAGPQFKQAYRGILNRPVVTRRIGDPAWPMVDVQDVTVDLLNDGELNGDWRGAPFTLSAYDAESGFLLLTGSFVVFKAVHNRGRVSITGKNVDQSILEAEIPKGVITLTEFPLAVDVGVCPTWLFGNVTNLPLPYVRDDQITSQFDYLLCRGDAAALTGLRRVPTGGAPAAGLPTSFEMTADELEPYPGMDGVLINGNLEGWDAGPTSVPDGYTLIGAGATVAKNITAGQVAEGAASASLTRAGADAQLRQNLVANAAALVPTTFWQGRELTISMRVFPSAGSQVQIRVFDGVATYLSALNVGTGAFETLTIGTVAIPLILNAAATSCVAGALVIVNGTVHIDDVRVYLRAKSLAECLRPDLYDGYTAIRTFLRQEDASGSLFQLVADVHGLQPERNPVRAIRTLLSDPTHGLGKTVDAASFDAAEAAICLTYDEAVRLDGPQVYLTFHDAIDDEDEDTPVGLISRDRSGYERHATVNAYSGVQVYRLSPNDVGTLTPPTGPSGDLNDAYIDPAGVALFQVPYDVRAAFDSASACTLELWYYIKDTVVSGGGAVVPLVEKRIGLAAKSGRFLSHESSAILFGVRANGGTLFTVSAALTAPADCNRWMHLVAVAAGGVLLLYKDGVLVGSGVYTGSLDTGDGVTAVGWWGTGIADVALYLYSRFAMYSTALSAARVAAHTAAITLDVEAVSTYDVGILAKSPTFFYRLTEIASVDMFDRSGNGHNGVYVGAPLMGPGIVGPLTAERGYVANASAIRLQNNVAKYGVETGMTLNDATATLAGWYKPVALKVPSGIVGKTIAGVRDTQWGWRQLAGTGPNGILRFTLVHAGGTLTLDVPLLPEDVGRWTWLVAVWAAGAIQVYKNGALAIEGTYTAPVASGVGDFYVGVQGTNGGPLTRPGQGDLSRWSYHPSAFTAADVAARWLAATWYNGGLTVDAALRDQRAARAWLEQICLLRGIRLGMTPDGPITVSVDAAAATTIRLHARDGAGDGERTIKDIGDLMYPPLDETVADVVVRGRRDQLSNTWLVERRRTVHANMGKDHVVELDCVREYPALDRVAAYLAGTLLDGERTVDVTMGQEARQLMEAELVMVSDAHLALDAEIMRAREVRKSLPEHGALLAGWSESPYAWTPTSYPSGANSG